MSNRDDDARKFAAAMRPTTYFRGSFGFFDSDKDYIIIPASDAPLHEQLAFVGRVAEALGCRIVHLIYEPRASAVEFAPDRETFDRHDGAEMSTATDLAWAAMLAALAVERSSR